MVKKPKLSLVFDEEKRREYLTGFHKRKLERKIIGRKLAEEKLKEEIKAVKEKYREVARKRIENANIPVLLEKDFENVRSHQKEIIGNHCVTVEEIDLSQSHYFMGSNKVETKEQTIPSSSPSDFQPKMSLKKALKMNPSKKRHRRSMKSKKKRNNKLGKHKK